MRRTRLCSKSKKDIMLVLAQREKCTIQPYEIMQAIFLSRYETNFFKLLHSLVRLIHTIPTHVNLSQTVQYLLSYLQNTTPVEPTGTIKINRFWNKNVESASCCISLLLVLLQVLSLNPFSSYLY